MGHPERVASLNNLAGALMIRFNRVGNLRDWNVAVGWLKEALELCSKGHPGRAISLNNLATAVMEARHPQDVDQVVEWYEEALELRPEGHPARQEAIFNLTTALLVRCDTDHTGRCKLLRLKCRL